MSTQITKPEPHAMASAEQHTYGVDPTVQWAMQNGATPEMLRELYQLQREMRADQARAAFFESFAAFKAEAVVVAKRTQVLDGPLKGKLYANLFDVASAVIPLLAKHGLSHSWKPTKDDPAWIEITCTVSHRLGHSESVPLGAAPDTGPGRNAIQARVSTISYLERITFLAAVGLAAGGTDDEGVGAGVASKPANKMGEEDYLSRLENIRNAATHEELNAMYRKAKAAAEAAKDVTAQQQFAREGEKRRGQLGPA